MGSGGPLSRGDSQEAWVGVCAPPCCEAPSWGFSAAHAVSLSPESSALPPSRRGRPWPHPTARESCHSHVGGAGEAGSLGSQPPPPRAPELPQASRVGTQHRGPWDTSPPAATPFGAGYLMTRPALRSRRAGLCLPAGGHVDFLRRWLVTGGPVGVLRV